MTRVEWFKKNVEHFAIMRLMKLKILQMFFVE